MSGRYEAAIATGIAVLAVAVSAYTAYIQRQQVRAQVWPIVQVSSGNEPEIRLWIANKGVGPASIQAVRVSLDGKPVRNWNELLLALYGHGRYAYAMNLINGYVLSAGEQVPVFVPHFAADQKQIAEKFDKDRFRIRMEICYCSTLGDCWRAISAADGSTRTEAAGRCPAPADDSFQQ